MAPRTVAPELPGFTYVDYLGGGGFADVFRYKDALSRDVAVKVLHRGVDQHAATSFDGEALLMAKLSNHPNIVTIYQAGVSGDGRPFIVMEMCSTRHLGERIARRPLTVAKAMEIGIQIAGAVETAHQLGILHRDIKPANILFTEANRPALADFGISVSGERSQAANAMSPMWAPLEQHADSGMPMGPWSDVFSLAATMWAMLAGRSPMEVPGGQNDRLSLRARARTFTMPPTGRQDVPDSLERVLATALSRNPQQRYQSAIEFARSIQGVQGQLNYSVTPIDVLSDEPEFYEDADDDQALGDTGTRISGFTLIDPERSDDVTRHTTGPSGGVTTPSDRSLQTTGGQPAAPANVVQHGRGYGVPGLRDFTAPATPSEQPRLDAAGAAATEAPDGSETKRSKKGLVSGMLAAVALLIVGVVFMVSGVMGGGSATAEPTPQVIKPQDPTVMRVPPVEDLEGVQKGDKATFTWSNPDPQPGDKYLYTSVVAGEDSVLEIVDEPTVVLPVTSDKTCIEVSLRRGSGRISDPRTACTMNRER